MKGLDTRLNQHFNGRVVRKDLTKLVKGNAIVPTYVLEYLLGQYCATDDEETVNAGVEQVKNIIARHFVHRDEAQVIKHAIRERGSHRIIDKVSVRLNDRRDIYEASFANLGLNKVYIDDLIVRNHPKLLSAGVWCLVTMGYVPTEERDSLPWIIESLKPIQVSNIDLEEFKEGRRNFSKEEWIDALMQSLGLNPGEFSFRSKLLQLSRLIPFAENNYNLIELGPKGTGKSHIYSEMSPHGILISGGEVTRAKLFVNNSTSEIGLVGYWDVVAYDEFAGRSKRADKGLVDIMKNYMANKSFSRGTEVYGAAASMVFVGNTDHSVAYMLHHSNLFEALPKEYYDTAFLDRLHAYLPGWEVQKLRNEMFTGDYGFIVDYLAEILKELRKEDYTQAYRQFFELSDSITTRDRDAISKSFSGLAKVIYPHGEFSEAEARELLEFAVENRKRVKEQLIKMDETFEEVDFSFTARSNGKRHTIETLEGIEYMGLHSDDGLPAEAGSGTDARGASGAELRHGEHIVIKENQKGISFARLFAAHLKGASYVHLADPYLQKPWQVKNLMEFCTMLLQITPPGEEASLSVITKYDEYDVGSEKRVRDMLSSVVEAFLDTDLKVEYEFDLSPGFHARYIEADTGWKIQLDRGLDIFQPYDMNNMFSLENQWQEKRACRGFEVTYLRVGENQR